MASPTFRQLHYFEALAQHQHFGRAAEACAISQPALSVQIRDLEQSLGTPLFERGARQVRLTGFGEVFAERVRPILRAVDDLGDLARAAHAQLAGRLRLGVIPTIAPYLLPTLLPRLSESHPGLEVHVRETLTQRLIAELHDARLDAAIVALPVSEPDLDEVVLLCEPMLLVRPAAQAGAPVPGAAALRQMQLLLLEEGHCFRDQALTFCNMAGSQGRNGLDCSSLSTLVQMVGAGIGVTLIPRMAATVETRSAPVAVCALPPPAPERRVGMIWRANSPLAGQFMQIAEVVRAATRALPAPDAAARSAAAAPDPCPGR